MTPGSHAEDKNDPHDVTPAQIGAAPAGYGLGGACQEIDSLDNAKETGFYLSGSGTPDGGWWTCVVQKMNDNYIIQDAYTRSDQLIATSHARRLYRDGWGEWEWENPPMYVGGERRTTERWNGKPVYAKLVTYTPSGTIGNASGNADILIPHGITGFNRLVRVESTVFYTIPLPLIAADGLVSTAVTTVNNTNIELRINKRTWTSAHPFSFALYYTK